MLYRIHAEDGDDLGEAAYGFYVQPGDDILISVAGKPDRMRVLKLVLVDEPESAYEGLLMVAPAAVAGARAQHRRGRQGRTRRTGPLPCRDAALASAQLRRGRERGRRAKVLGDPGKGTEVMGSRSRYKTSVDTVRLTAQQRHFYTADVELADYGRVMLIGDQDAVERLLAILGQHENHTLRLVPPEPPPADE